MQVEKGITFGGEWEIDLLWITGDITAKRKLDAGSRLPKILSGPRRDPEIAQMYIRQLFFG